jgi:hypothetical protein
MMQSYQKLPLKRFAAISMVFVLATTWLTAGTLRSGGPAVVAAAERFGRPAWAVKSGDAGRMVPYVTSRRSSSWLTRSKRYAPDAWLVSTSSSRLYGSNLPQRRDKKDEKDGGVLGAIKNAAKSILPKSWFQSEEEKKQAAIEKRVKDEVSSSITTLLKDFPLPVRMFGSMIAPLFETMASTFQEQQSIVDKFLSQAEVLIQRNSEIKKALSGTILSGTPFSQSSSTSSINGVTRQQVQVSFPIQGSSSGAAVARLVATEQGIQQLTVQLNDGRVIDIDTKSGGSSTSSGRFTSSSSSYDNDGIIEAEIIEKDTKVKR